MQTRLRFFIVFWTMLLAPTLSFADNPACVLALAGALPISQAKLDLFGAAGNHTLALRPTVTNETKNASSADVSMPNSHTIVLNIDTDGGPRIQFQGSGSLGGQSGVARIGQHIKLFGFTSYDSNKQLFTVSHNNAFQLYDLGLSKEGHFRIYANIGGTFTNGPIRVVSLWNQGLMEYSTREADGTHDTVQLGVGPSFTTDFSQMPHASGYIGLIKELY
jgi:hypothetical protein